MLPKLSSDYPVLHFETFSPLFVPTCYVYLFTYIKKTESTMFLFFDLLNISLDFLPIAAKGLFELSVPTLWTSKVSLSRSILQCSSFVGRGQYTSTTPRRMEGFSKSVLVKKVLSKSWFDKNDSRYTCCTHHPINAFSLLHSVVKKFFFFM